MAAEPRPRVVAAKAANILFLLHPWLLWLPDAEVETNALDAVLHALEARDCVVSDKLSV